MPGLTLIELTFIAAWCGIVLFIAYRICTKAGFPGYLAFGALIPVVNVVLALYLAFAQWPIERERDRLRGTAATTGP